MDKTTMKFLNALAALVFVFSNSVSAYAAEKEFWSARREAAQRQLSSNEAFALASLPNGGKGFLPPAVPESFWRLGESVSSRGRSALSQSLSRSLPPEFLRSQESLFKALSPAFGTVRSVALPEGTPRRTVLFIQDVHLNRDAQDNIAGVIRSLAEKKAVGYLALEGAWRPLEFSRFRTYPDRPSVERAAEILLAQNAITGPVVSSLTGPADFPLAEGVDDESLYQANVTAYRESAPRMAEHREIANREWMVLNAQKRARFNPSLAALDQAVENYHGGGFPLGDYVKALSSATPDLSARSPSVHLFLQALHREEKIDFKRVESDRRSLIAKLGELPSRQIHGLIEDSIAYRDGRLPHGDYYASLKNFCRMNGVDLKKFPAMEGYIAYVLAADQIDPSAFLSELLDLEKNAYDRLAGTPEEKKLVLALRHLRLTKKLISFSLTNEEWREYEMLSSEAPPRADLKSFEDFYRIAEARDEAMARTLLSRLEAVRSDTAVLVTGGFHTAGITRRLRDSGVAVIGFTPRITAPDSDSGSSYLGIFTQEKTPLEKLFAGHRLFLNIVLNPDQIRDKAALLVAAQKVDLGLAREALAYLKAEGVRALEIVNDGLRVAIHGKPVTVGRNGAVSLSSNRISVNRFWPAQAMTTIQSAWTQAANVTRRLYSTQGMSRLLLLFALLPFPPSIPPALAATSSTGAASKETAAADQALKGLFEQADSEKAMASVVRSWYHSRGYQVLRMGYAEGIAGTYFAERNATGARPRTYADLSEELKAGIPSALQKKSIASTFPGMTPPPELNAREIQYYRETMAKEKALRSSFKQAESMSDMEKAIENYLALYWGVKLRDFRAVAEPAKSFLSTPSERRQFSDLKRIDLDAVRELLRARSATVLAKEKMPVVSYDQFLEAASLPDMAHLIQRLLFLEGFQAKNQGFVNGISQYYWDDAGSRPARSLQALREELRGLILAKPASFFEIPASGLRAQYERAVSARDIAAVINWWYYSQGYQAAKGHAEGIAVSYQSAGSAVAARSRTFDDLEDELRGTFNAAVRRGAIFRPDMGWLPPPASVDLIEIAYYQARTTKEMKSVIERYLEETWGVVEGYAGVTTGLAEQYSPAAGAHRPYADLAREFTPDRIDSLVRAGDLKEGAQPPLLSEDEYKRVGSREEMERLIKKLFFLRGRLEKTAGVAGGMAPYFLNQEGTYAIRSLDDLRAECDRKIKESPDNFFSMPWKALSANSLRALYSQADSLGTVKAFILGWYYRHGFRVLDAGHVAGIAGAYVGVHRSYDDLAGELRDNTGAALRGRMIIQASRDASLPKELEPLKLNYYEARTPVEIQSVLREYFSAYWGVEEGKPGILAGIAKRYAPSAGVHRPYADLEKEFTPERIGRLLQYGELKETAVPVSPSAMQIEWVDSLEGMEALIRRILFLQGYEAVVPGAIEGIAAHYMDSSHTFPTRPLSDLLNEMATQVSDHPEIYKKIGEKKRLGPPSPPAPPNPPAKRPNKHGSRGERDWNRRFPLRRVLVAGKGLTRRFARAGTGSLQRQAREDAEAMANIIKRTMSAGPAPLIDAVLPRESPLLGGILGGVPPEGPDLLDRISAGNKDPEYRASFGAALRQELSPRRTRFGEADPTRLRRAAVQVLPVNLVGEADADKNERDCIQAQMELVGILNRLFDLHQEGGGPTITLVLFPTSQRAREALLPLLAQGPPRGVRLAEPNYDPGHPLTVHGIAEALRGLAIDETHSLIPLGPFLEIEIHADGTGEGLEELVQQMVLDSLKLPSIARVLESLQRALELMRQVAEMA